MKKVIFIMIGLLLATQAVGAYEPCKYCFFDENKSNKLEFHEILKIIWYYSNKVVELTYVTHGIHFFFEETGLDCDWQKK